MPKILLTFLKLRAISLFLGMEDLLLNSCTGENSPPIDSCINKLALSIAKVCSSKSTPRSNLVDASVCSENFLARPLITSGLKKALSR